MNFAERQDTSLSYFSEYLERSRSGNGGHVWIFFETNYPAHPATFIIYKDRVETENANNPHGEGPIDPNNFAPFPKNPAIAKFFMQLGRVEELGSGVLNVNRFIKEYSGTDSPQFIEGPIFKMVIPVNEGVNVISEGINSVNEGLKSLLEAIRSNPGIKAKDLVTLLDNRPLKTIDRQIKELVIKEYIERQGSKKTGGYHVTVGFTQRTPPQTKQEL